MLRFGPTGRAPDPPPTSSTLTPHPRTGRVGAHTRVWPPLQKKQKKNNKRMDGLLTDDKYFLFCWDGNGAA